MSRNLNLLKNCEKQLDQKTPEHRPDTKTELADITGKEIIMDYGTDDYTEYLSDLEINLPRINFSEGLKALNCERQYNDENLDMYYRMQLTSKENESIFGFFFVDPKTKKIEIPPRIYEPNDVNKAF